MAQFNAKSCKNLIDTLAKYKLASFDMAGALYVLKSKIDKRQDALNTDLEDLSNCLDGTATVRTKEEIEQSIKAHQTTLDKLKAERDKLSKEGRAAQKNALALLADEDGMKKAISEYAADFSDEHLNALTNALVAWLKKNGVADADVADVRIWIRHIGAQNNSTLRIIKDECLVGKISDENALKLIFGAMISDNAIKTLIDVKSDKFAQAKGIYETLQKNKKKSK